jgi:hypothetical protein
LGTPIRDIGCTRMPNRHSTRLQRAVRMRPHGRRNSWDRAEGTRYLTGAAPLFWRPMW